MPGKNNKQRDNILHRLNTAAQEFEKTVLFLDYEDWRKLTYPEQMKRRAEWDQYYQDVQKTVAFAIFSEQREAAAKKDWARVKDLAAQSKQMREDGAIPELPKPKHRDPFDFDNEMRPYWIIKKKIRELLDYPDVGNASPSEIFTK